MLYLIVKAALSGVIVAAVSEIAKRSPGFGALVASLPLVSILAMIWLWRDTGDAERIAALAQSTFWLVLPSLPLFLVLPLLLRHGLTFWRPDGVVSADRRALFPFPLGAPKARDSPLRMWRSDAAPASPICAGASARQAVRRGCALCNRRLAGRNA